MSNLQLFQFNSSEVRIVLIDSEPWFVATDVLQATGSSTTVTALKSMIEDDLGDGFVINQVIIDTMGRNKTMLCLSQSALTMFISRSRTKLGKELNRWIHAEVLPSIRRTGGYISTQGKTKLQILAETFQQMVDLEEKQKAQGLKLVEHDDILQEHSQTITELSNEMDRYTDGDGHYMTVIGYANLNKIKVDRNAAKGIGTRCSKLYRDKFHKEPPKVSDGRFGSVNSYPKDIINQVFLEIS